MAHRLGLVSTGHREQFRACQYRRSRMQLLPRMAVPGIAACVSRTLRRVQRRWYCLSVLVARGLLPWPRAGASGIAQGKTQRRNLLAGYSRSIQETAEEKRRSSIEGCDQHWPESGGPPPWLWTASLGRASSAARVLVPTAC
eukprot:3831494-Rhodomonas_salina.1